MQQPAHTHTHPKEIKKIFVSSWFSLGGGGLFGFLCVDCTEPINVVCYRREREEGRKGGMTIKLIERQHSIPIPLGSPCWRPLMELLWGSEYECWTETETGNGTSPGAWIILKKVAKKVAVPESRSLVVYVIEPILGGLSWRDARIGGKVREREGGT
ncbi:hypothetical protein BC939DRAFT_203569 [Gamsiella multidivaricata]|uniref:uncharacterized protein n=1 Tax=Gamsiella multidivaricata TaxID=101098 RepID=UPI00222107AF|nr:uncharacterized protein BC939DRAFT_203569 [Gamsiella multidivaricata]KAI7821501.1 hypothetical protein BC939DRAFT_203569 [Gamsiella multidivaricata]